MWYHLAVWLHFWNLTWKIFRNFFSNHKYLVHTNNRSFAAAKLSATKMPKWGVKIQLRELPFYGKVLALKLFFSFLRYYQSILVWIDTEIIQWMDLGWTSSDFLNSWNFFYQLMLFKYSPAANIWTDVWKKKMKKKILIGIALRFLLQIIINNKYLEWILFKLETMSECKYLRIYFFVLYATLIDDSILMRK